VRRARLLGAMIANVVFECLSCVAEMSMMCKAASIIGKIKSNNQRTCESNVRSIWKWHKIQKVTMHNDGCTHPKTLIHPTGFHCKSLTQLDNIQCSKIRTKRQMDAKEISEDFKTSQISKNRKKRIYE
jgi:hypothetical protein